MLEVFKVSFFQLKRLQVGVARGGKLYKKADYEKNPYNKGRIHTRSRLVFRIAS